MSGRGFILIFLFCSGLFLPGLGEASDDFQYWSGYNFTKKISPATRVFYEPEFRLRSDASDFFHHKHRVGVQQQLFGPYTLGLNYVIGRTQKSSGAWETENRGELDLSGKWNWRSYQVSLRGRAELRYVDNDGKDELWRFRIKPQLSHPMKVGQTDVTPYVADDIFYDADAGAWNQNRLYAGLVFPIKKEDMITINFDVYYMLENKRGSQGDWSANHILGTKVTFSF